MSTRKLTLEEKVKIVHEAEQLGFTETALKHNISSVQIKKVSRQNLFGDFFIILNLLLPPNLLLTA